MPIYINKIEGEITVDGKVLHGARDIVIDDKGNMTINGNNTEKLSSLREISSITINGNVGSITSKFADVEVSGDVTGSIATTSGDVTCKNVGGNISTMSGDVDCDKVGGSISTMSGDISHT